MGAILVDSSAPDAQRREMLYDGNIFFYTPKPAVKELTSHAWEMICEAFGSNDPMTAQDAMPVEQFVDLVGSAQAEIHPLG